MRILAWFFYVLAVLDFTLGNFCEIDFTGVSWSPILLGGIGAFFGYIAKGSDKSKDIQNEKK